MSQVGRVGEIVCAYIGVCLQSGRWRCQFWSADKTVASMWERQADSTICETSAEGGHANDGDFVDVTFYN
jgi:hypothetical protein